LQLRIEGGGKQGRAGRRIAQRRRQRCPALGAALGSRYLDGGDDGLPDQAADHPGGGGRDKAGHRIARVTIDLDRGFGRDADQDMRRGPVRGAHRPRRLGRAAHQQGCSQK
jgi:hypothetical protein